MDNNRVIRVLFMEIGGYFELESHLQNEYHTRAIRLNTGRNSLEYILRAKSYKKVYIPYFTCDVMLETVKKLNLQYEFYKIDKSFIPIFDFSKLNKNEVFVYNNYFGICSKNVKKIVSICENIIIDNSQAFFSKVLPNTDTFYSPRKFFGLPDGAYLYTNQRLYNALEKDISYNRMEHLLGRIDIGAKEFYKSFKQNNNKLVNQPIKIMSNLTKHLLQNFDYEHVLQKRRENYSFLDNHLHKTNLINVSLNNEDEEMVPMIYPYLLKNGHQIKKKLLENKIYIATYWPNVLEWVENNTWESNLTSNLIALPIDQRYNINTMRFIIKIINLKNE